VAAIQAAEMVRHANQVILYGLALIFDRERVGSHVEPLEREVDMRVVLLLAGDLSVHVAKHATTAAV